VTTDDPQAMTEDPHVTTADPPLDLASRQGLEALLFLADEPLSVESLAEALEQDPAVVEAALGHLAASFEADGRGIEIRRAAGGWRMYTAAGARAVLERWALLGRTGRLTQAALETLAVIAYKQPIGRQDVSEIRGVNADGAVRSLVARGFVREVARDDGPGQAVLYGTTPTLLERLGLDSLDELPPLTDYLPEAPAPDEPELGTLKDVRRRLAAGEELPSRSLGGRSAVQTNTGIGEDGPDEDDEAMPAPTARIGAGRRDDAMDDLTDRLEQVARSAVDRLRQAVAAGEERDAELDEDEAQPDASDVADAGTTQPGAPDAAAASDAAEVEADPPGAADAATSPPDAGDEEPDRG
jgi:segregation and condensation protein B